MCTEAQKNEIFNQICDRISKGESLRGILKDSKPICRDTFNEWIKKDKEKSDQYARAKEDMADAKFESIEQDYLEEPQRDLITGKIDSGWVQLQRLKIDAKKWELGKLNPKKYSDSIRNEISGLDGKPIQFVINETRNYESDKEAN